MRTTWEGDLLLTRRLPSNIVIEHERDASFRAHEIGIANLNIDGTVEGWVKLWCFDDGRIAFGGSDGNIYTVGHHDHLSPEEREREESNDEPGHAAQEIDSNS